MAPTIKEEKDTTVTIKEEEEQMELDENSEVEEEHEEEEDDEMDEEPDLVVSPDKVEIIGNHADATAVTFCFKDEDHTLGNSLRHVINKNPDVDFCGYSIPHPSEAKMNVRIQTTDKTNAIEALKTGLSNLYDLVAHVRQAYEEDLAKKEYIEFEEVA
ncbi:DNA-directed RNA polymerase [Cokeromyces recurvatus]|uniref:DNA-directed RNA polymerase n=1 Tax=Cokeromyces recurvatus TaxID=90255 RepID=UPI002220B2BF|nr:DNA-directed RNA polymerase [Cokeromyces recurvatus]KAI7897836.1 DNA-directed RNA polymerase [Cokeromyces recurvatus]